MLKNAGLAFEAIPSEVDEPAIVGEMEAEGYEARGIALQLAKQKALDVSQKYPDALVIGSDQTLEFKGEFITKAENANQAFEKLSRMRGSEHTLVSGVSVALGGSTLWQHIDDAYLEMRNFDDDFLRLYCDKAGDALVHCVGAYEFEGMGSWLFNSIKGDFFTILGMPLLPLLKYLHETHGIQP
ncbi:MAG: Maf family protein [Pseudomonadota bacterium]